MKKTIAVVVPTIRPSLLKSFEKAWMSLFEKHNIEYIVVADGDTPAILHKNDSTNIKRNVPEGLVQHHYTGVVNLGYAYIAQNLPDVEYIMTFHDDETPIGDPIQDHIDALNMRVPISWFSTTIIRSSTDYMRGFPYGVREEAPVMFSHGVWKGIPDWDAPTQLHANKKKPIQFYRGPIPKGSLFPLCGMNLAFRRAALPYVYFAPVAEYKGAERFDDIWGGIELKKDFDEMNWAVVTGYAQVMHNRASDVFQNLKKESTGILMNENYWKGTYDEWYTDFILKRNQWIKYMTEEHA